MIRFVHELPDDAGFVFVTDVPGAPFQIMGRRREDDGTLFVSKLLVGDLGGRSISEAFPPDFGVEILTGAEAERLIFEVQSDANVRWQPWDVK